MVNVYPDHNEMKKGNAVSLPLKARDLGMKIMRGMMIFSFLGILGGFGSTTYVNERDRSPHFKDGKFSNGIEPDKSWWDLIVSKVKDDWSAWPDWVESPYGSIPPKKVHGSDIRVTPINHSTVLIQTGGYNILTDPIYSESCSPIPFTLKRVRNPGIRFEELPKIDVVIISHDHYDHLDLPTINRIVARDHPKIYLGLGVGERLESMTNVKELDWWEGTVVGKNFSLFFVPVQHFSGRTPFDQYSTLWGGFVLEINGRKIYFGGDSGYASHYKDTFDKFGPMDVSLLPIGGYAPRHFMAFPHLDPKQAVQAHQDLRSRKSIGIHFGTFRLTAERIDEPIELLAKETKMAGLKEEDFIAAEFGDPVVLPGPPTKNGSRERPYP